MLPNNSKEESKDAFSKVAGALENSGENSKDASSNSVSPPEVKCSESEKVTSEKKRPKRRNLDMFSMDLKDFGVPQVSHDDCFFRPKLRIQSGASSNESMKANQIHSTKAPKF